MASARRETIGVDDRVSPARAIPLGIQHMMSMFGSTVLVPALTGLNPNVAIMCSGIGTIIYLLLTKNKIPSYLGSSFAFISPILAATAATGNVSAALSGVVAAGLVYFVVAGIIRVAGTDWLDTLLPPVLVASVMIVIGVGLSSTAAKMALFSSTDAFVPLGALVAFVTLVAAVVFSSMGGLFGTMPVLLSIIVGYVLSAVLGMVDFAPVLEAAWVGLPPVSLPTFDLGAIALAALISTIPVPVMGGVSLLLFGLIASNGLSMLVNNHVDFSENRNLMIASVTIILGVGMECAGIAIPLGNYTLPGMATATLAGIVLNLILPGRAKA